MPKTQIIAELGVNHNADLKLAFRLIDAAVESGADAVKFQTAVPELVATRYAPKANYQNKDRVVGESQLEMIRKILFPIATFSELKRYCDKKGATFFSTAFDAVSLKYLDDLGQPYHKIASGEITNLPFLRQVARLRKTTLLSSGMATLGEIEMAIATLEKEGLSHEQITVLHCNTEYPTSMVDVNLNAMLTIRDAFRVSVGYSDHTGGTEVPVAAVALGAVVIEKHFTLDRNLPGPDHKASLEPEPFKNMVAAIRNIELALGDGIKRPSASEIKNLPVVRRSIVAARAIPKGEIFDEKSIAAKRPGTGISPMRWDEVLGRKALRDYKADEAIEL